MWFGETATVHTQTRIGLDNWKAGLQAGDLIVNDHLPCLDSFRGLISQPNCASPIKAKNVPRAVKLMANHSCDTEFLPHVDCLFGGGQSLFQLVHTHGPSVHQSAQ